MKDVMDIQMTKAAASLYDILISNTIYFSNLQHLLLAGCAVSFVGWDTNTLLKYSKQDKTLVKVNKQTGEETQWDYKELMQPGWYLNCFNENKNLNHVTSVGVSKAEYRK